MKSLLPFIAAFLVPFCFGAVPFIFDIDEVNNALQALIPDIDIQPGTAQFGGCSNAEVATITNAWNAAMQNVIPDVQDALAQPVGTLPQIDNIFEGLFGFTTDQGIDFPAEDDISGVL